MHMTIPMVGVDGRHPIDIEERREGRKVVITPVGRLDSLQAPLLESRIRATIGRGDCHIVLNCDWMTHISSAGVVVLYLCAKTCRQKKGKLVIVSPGSQCRSAMDACGLLSYLECHETVEAGLASLESD